MPRASVIDNQTDEALAVAAASNPAIFVCLYNRYYQRVHRYCGTRSRSREEAEDLAQQTFVLALNALSRFQPRGSFAAWLFRIAHNLTLDHARRQRAPASWEMLPDAELPVSTDGDPETTLLRKERLEALQQAAEVLSAEQRELLALRFSVGLSVREVASAIGKSESATKMQLLRTLRQLKGRLQSHATLLSK